MVRISVRVDAALHERLQKRASGAELAFSTFIRSVLEQVANPGGRDIYSSQDEILAACLQILSILATLVGNRASDTLAKGMDDARTLLRQRSLLNPEHD